MNSEEILEEISDFLTDEREEQSRFFRKTFHGNITEDRRQYYLGKVEALKFIRRRVSRLSRTLRMRYYRRGNIGTPDLFYKTIMQLKTECPFEPIMSFQIGRKTEFALAISWLEFIVEAYMEGAYNISK